MNQDNVNLDELLKQQFKEDTKQASNTLPGIQTLVQRKQVVSLLKSVADQHRASTRSAQLSEWLTRAVLSCMFILSLALLIPMQSENLSSFKIFIFGIILIVWLLDRLE